MATDIIQRRPRAVLLLESDDPAASGDVCTSMLSIDNPEDTHLLLVTVDSSPDDRLGILRSHNGDLPARTGVINVGETTRSAASSAPSGPGPRPVTINTVADPSDLTGIGMAISSYLDAWADLDATPVVCFHSISALLPHTDKERVFRFLHAVTGRLRDVGAYVHYHLDPAAHDEATVRMIRAIFDAEIRFEDDGSVSIDRSA